MVYAFDELDNDQVAWISHLLAVQTMRLTPPSWVDTARVVDRSHAPLVTLRRPVRYLAHACGFPFRSVVDHAEFMFLPDRESAYGYTAAWDLMDWELLVYDGVLLANVGRGHHGFDSLGMAFRPLWIGTLLNTIVYAALLWCAWLGCVKSMELLRRRPITQVDALAS